MEGNKKKKSKIPTRNVGSKSGKKNQKKQSDVLTTATTSKTTKIATRVKNKDLHVETETVVISHEEVGVKTPSTRIPRLKSSSVDSGFSSTIECSPSIDYDADQSSTFWEHSEDSLSEEKLASSTLDSIPISEVVIIDEIVVDDGPKDEELVKLTADTYEIVITDQDESATGSHGLLVISEDAGNNNVEEVPDQVQSKCLDVISSGDEIEESCEKEVKPEVVILVTEEKVEFDETDLPIISENLIPMGTDNDSVEPFEPKMINGFEDIREQEAAEVETQNTCEKVEFEHINEKELHYDSDLYNETSKVIDEAVTEESSCHGLGFETILTANDTDSGEEENKVNDPELVDFVKQEDVSESDVQEIVLAPGDTIAIETTHERCPELAHDVSSKETNSDNSNSHISNVDELNDESIEIPTSLASDESKDTTIDEEVVDNLISVEEAEGSVIGIERNVELLGEAVDLEKICPEADHIEEYLEYEHDVNDDVQSSTSSEAEIEIQDASVIERSEELKTSNINDCLETYNVLQSKNPDISKPVYIPEDIIVKRKPELPRFPEVQSKTERILATSNMLKACLGHRPSIVDISHRSSSVNTENRQYLQNLQVTNQNGDLLMATPDEVFDITTLEKMLDAAGHYEQRRRIRAQIRLLKKSQDGEGSQRLTNDYSWQRVDDLVSSSLVSAHYGLSHNQQRTNKQQFNVNNKETSSVIMGDNSLVNGINLLSIQDELVLHEMLDKAEDYEDRKKIRSRLKDVLADQRAYREEIIRKREQDREDSLRNRVRDAEEQKRRTLAMYDAMAKSAPAGGNKVMDINYLREEMNMNDADSQNRCKENLSSNIQKMHERLQNACTASPALSFTYSQLLSVRNSVTNNSENQQNIAYSLRSSTFTSKEGAPGSPTTIEPHKVDQIEQAIRQRQIDANERKARVLAAYDTAAKSGPAGSARFIDFDGVKQDDIQNMQSKPNYSSCFQMKGGVPIAAKGTAPVILPRKVEEEYDPMEEAIRKRQRESDERKRRTLEAYDKAARSRPAGAPISIYIPVEFGVEPVFEVANKAKHVSPREKFQRMDSSSSSSANGTKSAPGFSVPKPVVSNVTRSPTAIKEMLLNWVKSKTKEYQNVKIENFSTTWNDGMAFCALIHHFYPDAFDFDSLDPKNRRFNFDLAFRVAEEKGDVAPLLETDDMVMMKKPDWKCVFTYVQSLYRRFHNVD